MNKQPEALILADDRPSAIGDDLYQWALDAEGMIRGLHTRVQELEKDLKNAKRLVSKVWNQHPEAREAIEEGTGAWMVFGQDVETSVPAQRVTQAADHIAQDRKMVAAQEPFGYFKAEPFGWRDCAETDEGAIALYEAPQPQADALDADRYRWLRSQPLESDVFCITIWRKGTDGFGDDLRLEKLDEAIDAAIAKATGGAT